MLIAVNQAGYNTQDHKSAYIITNDILENTEFSIFSNTSKIYSGTLIDNGIHFSKRVYFADFSEVTTEGVYTVEVCGVRSFQFPIAKNVYKQYCIDLMSYYRIQRSATDTAALMAEGQYGERYGNNLIVTKGYHPAAFLNDAQGSNGIDYDITGGWFDAGDYGIYSENQWVLGQMAITYMENMKNANSFVNFDFDRNGIPDIIDELIFSAKWSLKLIDADRGIGHNVQKFVGTTSDDKGQWKHPEKYTGQRYFDIKSSSVEGSAKMSASLAAVARALKMAVTNGSLTLDQLNSFTYDQKNLVINETLAQPEIVSFFDACKTRAITAYQTALKYDGEANYPRSNYLSRNGLTDPLIFAEAELYLLTGDIAYFNRVRERIMALNPSNIESTNYWSVSNLAMAELYPVIKATDSELAAKIKTLLKGEMVTFLERSGATPYYIAAEFKAFGVNEAHMSYVSDAIRYYKLFKYEDPEMASRVLAAAEKGLNWVFGANPWNISWVSGIGENFVKGLHSRLNEDKDQFILPGALAAGPLFKAGFGISTESPWYEDNLLSIDSNNWRYNEHSISIEIGLFNSLISLVSIRD